VYYGLNRLGFPHETLENNLAVAADAGYDGVELAFDADELADPALQREVAETVAGFDLTVPSIHSPALNQHPITSPDPAVRERGVERARQLLAAADRLDANRVLLVPGRVDADIPYDVAYDNALGALREVAQIAAEYDCTIAVENVWNDFLLSPREFADFVDSAADHGPVGAYFDVGNVRTYGHPEQWIRILGERIDAIHVKDFDTEVGTHHGFTYPLQGDVDWTAVASALDDVGFDGWITLETPPYESGAQRMPAQVLENLRWIFDSRVDD
jgi:hexulose-6-phosphate isomerase